MKTNAKKRRVMGLLLLGWLIPATTLATAQNMRSKSSTPLAQSTSSTPSESTQKTAIKTTSRQPLASNTPLTNITLTECYQWSRDNYPLILQFKLIEQSRLYNLSNAAKGYLPQGSLTGKASYQSQVTQLPVSLPGMSIPAMSKDQYGVSVDVTQTLWDGGAIGAQKQVISAQSEADKQQVEVSLYAIKERVNDLYFGALLYNEMIAQNSLLQNDLKTNIEKIEALLSAGMANQTDLEQMQVELLRAQQKATELSSARGAYLQMLAVMINRPINNQTRLELPVAENPLHTTDTPEILRPELTAFEQQKAAISAQQKALNAALMPRLGLFVQGGYGRPGLNMLKDSFEPFYVGGLRLSWSFGQLYTRKNDRSKIETNLHAVDVQRLTFLFNTQLQLTQQQADIQKIETLTASDAEILRLQSNILRSAEVRLQQGVISVTDFIREINAEHLARQEYAVHKIQHLMAIYKYKHTENR